SICQTTCGSNLPNTHTSTPATMAKLIHLKISVARSVAALPRSSAACKLTDAKNDTNRILTAKKTRRFRVIEPLSRVRPDGVVLAGCGAQFQRKVARLWRRRLGELRQVPRSHALSLRSLRPQPSCALP